MGASGRDGERRGVRTCGEVRGVEGPEGGEAGEALARVRGLELVFDGCNAAGEVADEEIQSGVAGLGVGTGLPIPPRQLPDGLGVGGAVVAQVEVGVEHE